VTRGEGRIFIEKRSELLQKRSERGKIEPSHGDERLVDVGIKQSTPWRQIQRQQGTRGIFLERRRRSSSERLFMNFFLYLECFFTAGESPVTVILKRSNLNVHEEGVI